jgi:cation diffusion facilitator CzcD-associated flavoprotein CzcO
MDDLTSNLSQKLEDNALSQTNHKTDVIIIGGGQSGLSVSYFLRRHAINFTILDSEKGPGGAWRHGWSSLHLFSPAKWSSLPGWPMPETQERYPTRNQVINYLSLYEKRYAFPIKRPIKVNAVKKENNTFIIYTDKGLWNARALVNATRTWSHPFIPPYPGREIYRGTQTHSAFHTNPEQFYNKRVLIVGGGNSGAQILAEVSKVAETTWVTIEEPLFLPDDVDGRVLFERATEKWRAMQQGRSEEAPSGSLANIVMVPSVKEAREPNVLRALRPFSHFIEDGVVWQDGTRSYFDGVIWCTGFRPALEHLRGLDVIENDGKVKVQGNRSIKEPHLWLVGHGDWTGYASATLIGVTRTARSTANEITESLK